MRSPMALDLYSWLTYRMSYLERLTGIPWGALQLQFGADYPYIPLGTADYFKRKALAPRFSRPSSIQRSRKVG